MWVLRAGDLSLASVWPITETPLQGLALLPDGLLVYLIGGGRAVALPAGQLQEAGFPPVPGPFPKAWLNLQGTELMQPLVHVSPQWEGGQTAFALVGGYGEFYRTTDGGASWQFLPALTYPDFYYLQWLSISPNYAWDHTMTAHSGSGKPILRSTDGGENWRSGCTVAPPNCAGIGKLSESNAASWVYTDLNSVLAERPKPLAYPTGGRVRPFVCVGYGISRRNVGAVRESHIAEMEKPVQTTNVSRPGVEPHCLATTIGSLPHTDVVRGTALMFENTPEIPSWVQFPKRAFYEGMMVQFTEGIPGLVENGNQIYFNTAVPDFVEQLTDFYARYLAVTENGDLAALDGFGLSPKYAAGFTEFINRLPEHAGSHTMFMLKGQVTGPFTMGTNLLDQDRRCLYYHDQLRDVIVKTVALKAMWQITRLRPFGLPVMVFLDEPSLLGFGSQTFLAVSREDVVGDINEVAAAIHAQGGLAGVHCEENTDWSLLMETDLDILAFDAYDHMQAITLYPAELHAFLDRGGWLGWGIVPTLDREAAATETIPSLLARLEEGVQRLAHKGFDQELLLRRALITPSCGAGGVLTEPLADRVLRLLGELSRTLRDRYAFS